MPSELQVTFSRLFLFLSFLYDYNPDQSPNFNPNSNPNPPKLNSNPNLKPNLSPNPTLSLILAFKIEEIVAASKFSLKLYTVHKITGLGLYARLYTITKVKCTPVLLKLVTNKCCVIHENSLLYKV